MSDMLMFDLGAIERFALDVLDTREIIKVTQFHSLPNSHPFICGCINVRGSTVPVIDLPLMLFNRSLCDSKSVVILLDHAGGQFGLKVAEVHSIGKVDLGAVKMDAIGKGFTEGVYEQEGALIQILNVGRIIGRINIRERAA
jgi:two-component system chemotaxis response regulator CheV